ncbi:xanthine dehydrogenase family protein molybdopterin-binding subunit [Embleya scabrispora]|uniref:xanthine dehydrogenase family protein molybdopterin-binding subunit n=1 Tax=Embleya scabrispora TaxID=159449 RepID=UPI00037A08A3|nr:xanthine dehydrogenase family protein molybdopterin-binding subunit [Embleya scabrispora]MYS87671.1 molybdopterin-dependent oxidoreductase [Streptomyces sp. SID5474]
MSPQTTPWIGAAAARVDGPVKVTGTAIYTGDVALPELAHAVLVQSTIAKGRITDMDIAAAETAPGVLAVCTSDGSLGIGRVASYYSADNGPMGDGRTPLSDAVIHHHGQHIAMVVAQTLEEAVAGAERIRTRYRHQSPLVRIEDAIPQTPPGREDIVRGDLTTGLAVADVTVEAYYETPPQHMNPMEPCTTTAHWVGDRLTVYDSTQYVSGVRDALASAFGVPPANVRVLSGFVGGGFGSKGTVWPHVLLAAAAARLVDRPVRLALTRPQMFTSCGTRPATRQRIVLGAHRDGRLTAIGHDGTSATSPGENVVESTGGLTSILYACPNVTIRQRIVRLDMQAPTFQRAPGRAPGSFALESALDELAHELRMDPVELRLRNHADADPSSGRPWSGKHLRECYRVGAERFGWDPADRTPGTRREGDVLIGTGMASATHEMDPGPAAAYAELRVDGTAVIGVASHDIGTGTYTVLGQIAADVLGLPPERIIVRLGDTDLPEAPPSIGSQTVAYVGPAIRRACEAVRDDLLAAAVADPESPLYRREIGAIEFGPRTYVAELARIGEPSVSAVGHHHPDANSRYAVHSFGAHFAEVAVDALTGTVRVRRMVGAFDVGRVINPRTARSQLLGGMTFGLAQALMEATVIDPRRGHVVEPHLAGYHLPVNADIGTLDVLFVGEPDPHISDLGARGAGEIGVVGAAAAIANAVFHATGVRVRTLPITPDRVVAGSAVGG